MKNRAIILLVLIGLQIPFYGQSVRLKMPQRKIPKEFVYQKNQKIKFLKVMGSRFYASCSCKREEMVRLNPSLIRKDYWSKKGKR